MRFLAGEEGVGEDWPVEVAREDVLNLAGNAQLGRSDQGQFSPLASQVVTSPERPLVASCPLGLHIGAQLASLFAPLGLSLCDIVIPLTPDDLSP